MNLSKVLEQTKTISKEIGAFIRKERQHFDQLRVEHKGINDLVSYVDKEAEQKIVKRLTKILPGSGFITEEGTADSSGEEYTWIIDPLDGTTNFIHGLPIYSVSIGLMKGDEIILGVVYEVNFNECFSALKGHGAFCNDTPIHVSSAPTLGSSLIATGFPYSAFDHIDEYLAVMKSLMGKSHGLRRLGSAAVDLCYVASGRMDAYFEYNLHPWDVAAGSLIVQEAGGIISDFDKGSNFLFGKQIIASNSLIYGEFCQELQNVWKSGS